MTTENKTTGEQSSPMVQPGERALLLSHQEYRRVRKQAQGLESYDLLMRQPEDPEASEQQSESERWLPVRADKYLKHRATGWREAESLEELPDQYWDPAEERNVFAPFGDALDGGE